MSRSSQDNLAKKIAINPKIQDKFEKDLEECGLEFNSENVPTDTVAVILNSCMSEKGVARCQHSLCSITRQN